MLVLGVNAYHGDASAALLVDGELIAAAEEERFNRVKHYAGFPRLAVEYCLRQAGARIEDVDHVAIGRNTRAHLADKLAFAITQRPDPRAMLDRAKNMLKARAPKAALASSLGVDPERLRAKSHGVEHHRAHMASAFYASGWDEAALVSVDGFGDFVSTMWGTGKGAHIQVHDRVSFPHSLGIFYSAITQYLGFPKYGDEYKVMGLSAYGEPDRVHLLRRVLQVGGGSFRLGLEYFRHHTEGVAMTWEGEPHFDRLYTPALVELLGPERAPKSDMPDRFKSIAASAQALFEEALFEVLEKAQKLSGSRRLCLAGGCAHNSLAAGKIVPRGLFDEVFVQPAAGDAGTALGAALYVQHEVLKQPRRFVQKHAAYGPSYSQQEVETLLRDRGVAFEVLPDDVLLPKLAKDLAEGCVVGWFNGRMEWGPRALGHRSILADPRRTDMQDLMNEKIKRREMFRPFAPALPLEHVGAYFAQTQPDPFMTKVYAIQPDKRASIPAVTHVDGTGRLQTVTREENPRYHDLIVELGKRTGVPIVLNTSFNENEPIVCSPAEALDCYLRTKMDVLVMENAYVSRRTT
jgi:carbamoyltransferase